MIFFKTKQENVQRELVAGMGKTCDSRTHFAKCVEHVEGKESRVHWKCDHCKKIVFHGKQWKSHIARIHLAATETNGMCVGGVNQKKKGRGTWSC